MDRDIQDIKRDLKHVCWLGGSSCAGKTTISERFENELGFEVYHIDSKWYGDHIMAADPERHPTMVAQRETLSQGLSLPEIFETFPLDELVQSQINFITEEFEMIVDDVYAYPKDKPILVEGSQLLPSQVGPVTEPHQAIWLVASETFERKIRQQRIEEDPESDFEIGPWVDKMVTWSSRRKDETVSQAKQLGLKVIETDGTRSAEDTFDLIKSHFKLP